MVYASSAKDTRSHVSSCVLVRFSGAIESAFGFTREVMFFYSPHRDTQIRSFDSAKATLKSLSRQVTPDLIFFWSKDSRLKSKLEDWSSVGFTAIPLQLDEESDPIEFIALLRDHIFARELFYETTPVQGERFFGRKTLLQGLRDDITNGRVAGLYGLRKAGKTSVLKELQAAMKSSEHFIILQDLESLPSPPTDPIPQLLEEICTRLNLRLGDLATSPNLSPSDWSHLANFKVAMDRVLRDLFDHGCRLTLLLDEIEYLTPSEKLDIREGPMPTVAQFLGVLRSLAQENPNFTFLLSGLTSAITESGRLYGRPNPLFSWAKSYYLSPLTRLEADDLARTVGSRMGVKLTDDALAALYDASGGHAFLYRHLASHATRQLALNVFERNLTGPVVLASLETWRQTVSTAVREMTDHVSRYYPDEAFLIEVLQSDPEFFKTVASEIPSAVGHLLALGLITGNSRDGYQLSAILDMA